MSGNLQVTTVMLFAPLLAFFSPLLFLIGETALLTNVERSSILFFFSHHLLIRAATAS